MNNEKKKKYLLSAFWVSLCFLFISISLSIFIIPSFEGIERTIILIVDGVLTICCIAFCYFALSSKKEEGISFLFQHAEAFFDSHSDLTLTRKSDEKMAFMLQGDGSFLCVLLEENTLRYHFQDVTDWPEEMNDAIAYQKIAGDIDEEKIYQYILTLYKKQAHTKSEEKVSS